MRASRLVLFVLLLVASPAWSEPLRDAPVIWYDDDDRDIEQPEPREPNILWDSLDDTIVRPLGRLTNPVRALRRAGGLFGADHVKAAPNVNSLDEVPNSTWFTNRIGLFPMSAAEAARGPGEGAGPDRSGPWTVVSAKTAGVTPGFNIKDAHGQVYVIKFDLPEFDGLTLTAGVISNRVFYAAGYNTPEDVIVSFRREDLVLGDDVSIKLIGGAKRKMTDADLDEILGSVARMPDGSWRALSSKFLSGRPIGPFNYVGRRDDDPNDRVDHQHRRELRGLRLFSAWLNHFDTKQSNSLDMFVEQDGRRFVRHYLIDFASTLGVGANGPAPRYGHEYTLDPSAILGRLFTLGFYESGWRRIERPAGLDEVGFWESKEFRGRAFHPNQPNSAFVNMTDRDGYWAAKIISAFTDEHLAAIVGAAEYRDPAAAEYVLRVLAERRDKICREMFERVAPLDFFRIDGGVVDFLDLGVDRGVYPAHKPRYRARCSAATADRDRAGWSEWIETSVPTLDLRRGDAAATLASAPAERYPFIALECQLDRGDGWSAPVTAYFARASQRVVALER